MGRDRAHLSLVDRSTWAGICWMLKVMPFPQTARAGTHSALGAALGAGYIVLNLWTRFFLDSPSPHGLGTTVHQSYPTTGAGLAVLKTRGRPFVITKAAVGSSLLLTGRSLG